MNPIALRPARPADLARLTAIWHQGAHAAHAGILPAALMAHRTPETFRARLEALLPETVVAGPPGHPVGFCSLKGDELYQLFVDPAAQGTGVAARLVSDAEARLKARGVRVAWLACAVGNERAARFYRKCGWTLCGTITYHAVTTDGPFPIETWRFERAL